MYCYRFSNGWTFFAFLFILHTTSTCLSAETPTPTAAPVSTAPPQQTPTDNPVAVVTASEVPRSTTPPVGPSEESAATEPTLYPVSTAAATGTPRTCRFKQPRYAFRETFNHSGHISYDVDDDYTIATWTFRMNRTSPETDTWNGAGQAATMIYGGSITGTETWSCEEGSWKRTDLDITRLEVTFTRGAIEAIGAGNIHTDVRPAKVLYDNSRDRELVPSIFPIDKFKGACQKEIQYSHHDLFEWYYDLDAQGNQRKRLLRSTHAHNESCGAGDVGVTPKFYTETDLDWSSGAASYWDAADWTETFEGDGHVERDGYAHLVTNGNFAENPPAELTLGHRKVDTYFFQGPSWPVILSGSYDMTSQDTKNKEVKDEQYSIAHFYEHDAALDPPWKRIRTDGNFSRHRAYYTFGFPTAKSVSDEYTEYSDTGEEADSYNHSFACSADYTFNGNFEAQAIQEQGLYSHELRDPGVERIFTRQVRLADNQLVISLEDTTERQWGEEPPNVRVDRVQILSPPERSIGDGSFYMEERNGQRSFTEYDPAQHDQFLEKYQSLKAIEEEHSPFNSTFWIQPDFQLPE